MSALKQSVFIYSTLSGKKCAQQKEMKDLQLKVYLWRVGAVYQLVVLCSEMVVHFYKDVHCITACSIQILSLFVQFTSQDEIVLSELMLNNTAVSIVFS